MFKQPQDETMNCFLPQQARKGHQIFVLEQKHHQYQGKPHPMDITEPSIEKINLIGHKR